MFNVKLWFATAIRAPAVPATTTYCGMTITSQRMICSYSPIIFATPSSDATGVCPTRHRPTMLTMQLTRLAVYFRSRKGKHIGTILHVESLHVVVVLLLLNLTHCSSIIASFPGSP